MSEKKRKLLHHSNCFNGFERLNHKSTSDQWTPTLGGSNEKSGWEHNKEYRKKVHKNLMLNYGASV